ncbi:hypothetical protein Taro_016215 [Colocasia esculenta]|uniref:DUF8040 domain-containing protein n=1 Tax=Colocasia esculenta TaxID=4460 RepID=A0A843UK21_COLES|nr:hypothetical protein [Colocasia esculenta]
MCSSSAAVESLLFPILPPPFTRTSVFVFLLRLRSPAVTGNLLPSTSPLFRCKTCLGHMLLVLMGFSFSIQGVVAVVFHSALFPPRPWVFIWRYSSILEADTVLAMFLYAMGHGVATGAMCEHFQHSSETISFYVNRVIKVIALLRFTYIVLPTGTEPIHPRIRHDDRFYPYFKDVIGAIDGTYILAHVLKDRQARYRNRKNVISQNVMGVCDFDLIFHYVGVGFKGAAVDMTVLRRAIDVGGFTELTYSMVMLKEESLTQGCIDVQWRDKN